MSAKLSYSRGTRRMDYCSVLSTNMFYVWLSLLYTSVWLKMSLCLKTTIKITQMLWPPMLQIPSSRFSILENVCVELWLVTKLTVSKIGLSTHKSGFFNLPGIWLAIRDCKPTELSQQSTGLFTSHFILSPSQVTTSYCPDPSHRKIWGSKWFPQMVSILSFSRMCVTGYISEKS